jgi:hypothetical protein
MIRLTVTRDWDSLGDLIAKGKDPDKKSPEDASGTKSTHRSKEGSGHSKSSKSSKSDGSDSSTTLPNEVSTTPAKEEEGPQSIELASSTTRLKEEEVLYQKK